MTHAAISSVRGTHLLGMACIAACLFSGFANAQSATYFLTFRSEWNPATHPYPLGAHYSSLIGATHDDSAEFWRVGELASPGIERMAEIGSVSPLVDEIAAAGSAASLVTGQSINASGSTIAQVDANAQRPLLTLVTMVAPSPDWFVGVSALPLRDEVNWIHSLTVDLFAYDAGTDSGVDFTSPNANTNPAEPIALLGSPLAGSARLGVFEIVLMSVDALTGDFDLDGDYSTKDIDALVAEIVNETHSPAFDVNQDGQVNHTDLNQWLVEAGSAELTSGGAYVFGDTNLDGVVDVSDFNAWNNSKFTAGSGWSGGDLNADGFSDVADFNIWNENKFQTVGAAASLPEPSTWLLAMISGILAIGRRRGQSV